MPIGCKPLRQMDLVGRDHHPPPRHLLAHQVRIELLGAGDRLDLRRHSAGPGVLDLGHHRFSGFTLTEAQASGVIRVSPVPLLGLRVSIVQPCSIGIRARMVKRNPSGQRGQTGELGISGRNGRIAQKTIAR